MDIKKIFNPDKLADKGKGKIGKNYITNLFILLLIGVLLAMVSNTFKDKSATTFNSKPQNGKNIEENTLTTVSSEEQEEVIAKEEAEIERKLKDTLENIEGVGKVKVMVYFKGGEEQIPAININDSTSLTEEKDTDGGTRKITQKNDGRTIVMMNTENGTKPFVVKKYKPEVTGVCVVAEGAEDSLIKLQIHKAVINLFGLKESQVNVYSMKK
ncbi:stage III sporulation protein AG [Clostridium bovifaecis]|uniref:Stage III sporulation protein AG n=1 Tax=Clostridium bovifaecis TaxID=2184719 RepID=A0A6I6EN97_9CLOT|nr:stage III sporulation protein AG [Clostridium bovifaecis]